MTVAATGRRAAKIIKQMNDSRRRWCTLLTSSTVSGMQMRYSLIRTIALVVISERLPGRLGSRRTVRGAPAAAATNKAVADVELSEGRFGTASVGRWLAGWLVDWPMRGRIGKKKKNQKTTKTPNNLRSAKT